MPRDDQLRPITLLCLDYKILSKIMIITNRLLFGGHNILSVIQYTEKYGERGAVVSYDLYKAYDRVALPFLYLVMERMKFPPSFIASHVWWGR